MSNCHLKKIFLNFLIEQHDDFLYHIGSSDSVVNDKNDI